MLSLSFLLNYLILLKLTTESFIFATIFEAFSPIVVDGFKLSIEGNSGITSEIKAEPEPEIETKLLKLFKGLIIKESWIFTKNSVVKYRSNLFLIIKKWKQPYKIPANKSISKTSKKLINSMKINRKKGTVITGNLSGTRYSRTCL